MEEMKNISGYFLNDPVSFKMTRFLVKKAISGPLGQNSDTVPLIYIGIRVTHGMAIFFCVCRIPMGDAR